ncbi:aspartate/glutamate racemase family protein [candidate division KSB1 bacterium]|nr:aspartate/glutamate racemase family protein [candidate division KSB1 bacterium]
MLNLATRLSRQETATLIVTDSGLGGLSIAACLFERLRNTTYFKSARVIFFNSSFDNFSGYNKLDSHSDKVAMFNSALNSMTRKYKPDVIIIGCNTLSVIYPDTPFSKITDTPVVEIVEIGVHSIIKVVNRIHDESYHICIFGTPTTISSAVYSKKLTALGIHSSSISEIACSDLADKIEDDYTSTETISMIAACVNEASTVIRDKSTHVVISLNCTHYGYVAERFRESFQKLGYHKLSIVNPNPEMVEFLINNQRPTDYTDPTTYIEVVSRVDIFPHVMKSVGNLIIKTSPATVRAMKNYTKDPNLF